jgi:predicted neuraminidase
VALQDEEKHQGFVLPSHAEVTIARSLPFHIWINLGTLAMCRMKSNIPLALIVALGFLCTEASAELTIKKIFGPEIPGGTYKHPAAIEELSNGDLYIVYYGGDGEYEGDTAVFGSRRAKGTFTWSSPQKIADTPDRSEGNAVIWQAPDGIVWLFYVTRYGDTWSDSVVKYKFSKDNAGTWTDSELLSFEKGTMVRSQPIVLTNGDYLLPVYHETGADRDRTAADTCSYFFRFTPKSRTWSVTKRIHSANGNLQPAVVQIDDDRLIAYCRPGGDFEPDPNRFAIRAESRDGGATWSRGVDSEFPNPNSAVDLIMLRNGHLLLVYNDTNVGDRMPLTVAISTDDGKSWPHKRHIVNIPGDTAAYPYIIQSADGRLHGVYTSAERTIVNHFEMDESDVTESKGTD